MTPTLSWYLLVAAALFCLGVYGLMTRRNTIAILLSVELMANAVNLNLIAFSRFLGDVAGQVFTLFTLSLTVAEVAVGLAIVVLLHRAKSSINADEANLLRW